jgi:Flp pilus assembly protein TadG
MRLSSRRRRALVTVEAAVVYPLLFLLLFGLIVGGICVFRYQQMVLLSREAARYASVHGSSSQKETNQPPPTVAQITQQVILPLSAGMEPDQLTVQIQWISPATNKIVDWDSSSKAPTSLDTAGNPVANHVKVTVRYVWDAGILFSAPLTLQSVCEIPMSF